MPTGTACSCGGMNENCYRCSGSGVVEKQGGTVRFRERPVPGPPRKLSQRNTGPSPAPSSAVSKAITANATSSITAVAATQQKRVKVPRNVTKCPYCPVVATPLVLRDHIDLAHRLSKAK